MAYLDLASHANPKIDILEIGAGTGSTTSICLCVLGSGQDGSKPPRFGHWEYTDISRSFFGEAAEQFAREGDRMGFSVLNVENDPEQQGFESNTYDVVIASLVSMAPFPQYIPQAMIPTASKAVSILQRALMAQSHCPKLPR